MKVFLLTVLVLGAALAEPAFRRPQPQQAQEQAPQDQQDADDSSAPYGPSGWKPSGQRLELPGRQYGAPAPEKEDDATTEPPTETPPTPAEPKSQQQVAQGEYHVILPDGRLQRVQFAAKLEAKPAEQRKDAQDGEEESAADQPAPAHKPAARPGVRPVPRPQPAPKAQNQVALPVVAAPQYFVILPDGRVQQAQFFGNLEVETDAKEAQDSEEKLAAAQPGRRPSPARPAARPAPQPQQQRVAFPAQPDRQGKYYVVLPDGSLQQVEFVARLEAASPEVADTPAPRPRPAAAHPQQPLQPQPAVPSSFVAELRFMEVPPVTGPVFSYSSPLTRVQRFA